MNPFPTDTTIRAETCIGVAEILTSPAEPFLDCEDKHEMHNMNSSRRLQFMSPQTDIQANVNTIKGHKFPSDRPSGGCFHPPAAQEKIPQHLQQLFEESCNEGRTEDEKQQVATLLSEYQDIFSNNDEDLGLTNLAEHKIEMTNSKPIKQPFRRVPLAFVNEEKQAIDKLLKQGVIRPSNSPWASPLCLVRKKNGSVRHCVNYRRINLQVQPDAFPVPKIDECIDALSGAKIFSTIDMTSSYLQVPVREEDIPKTAFISKHGLYEFTSMPFGMINSGATFQRVMELAMKGLQWQICIIYVNDCIIFSSTFDEQRMVFQRLREANLKIKSRKSELLKREVTFLGFRVTGNGIKPGRNNVAKLFQWPVPANVTEVEQFLGLCSYYRKQIKGLSIITKPLFDLTKNDSKLVWTNACQTAFDSLKRALTGAPVMALPRTDGGQFILDVDACNYGIGGVLSQLQDGEELVIAYASRSLNRAETNYCVTDKELLAIKYFVEYFRHCLLGRHFTVRSGHRPLKFLFSMKSPSGRIARWIEILSGYDFEVQYRQASKHTNADSLSRCPNPKDCSCPDTDEEESLKYGPCKKCLKRAEQMDSDLLSTRDSAGRQTDDIITQQTSRCSTSSTFCESVKENVLSLVKATLRHAALSVAILVLMMIVTNDCAHFIVGSVMNPPILQYTAGAVILSLVSAVSQGKVNCMGTELMQIFNGKIWPNCSVPVKDIKLATCSWLRLVRTVTTRSKAQEPWLPWSDGYTSQEVQEMQKRDIHIGPIIAWFSSGRKPEGSIAASASPETRHYLQCWDALVLQDGVHMRGFEKKDGSGVFRQLVTPGCLRKDVLFQMHNSILSGHLGRKKTKEKLLQWYYWYQAREDVNLWVSRCDICGANKPPVHKPRAPLGSMPVGALMDRMSTDLIGPFPRTLRGNRYVLVVTDQFSHWVEVLAIRDQSAETAARTILIEVIAGFGSPISIHSDLGGNYESRIFRELCDLLEIKKSRTSVRNPKGNGQTEFNKTLVQMVRAYLTGEQNEWDLNLRCLATAYVPHPMKAQR